MRIEEVGSHIELYFDGPPEDKLKASLQICGWRFYWKKKCWSNFNNAENMIFAKKLAEELAPRKENFIHSLPKHVITPTNLIIRSNSFYCNLNHNVIDVAAQIDVCLRNGDIVSCLVPAAYCETCNEYFILESTYTNLKKKGVLLCQVMTLNEHHSMKSDMNDFSNWSEKSPLKIFGYSVNQADGLSDTQRQAILESIIDYNVMTKDRVLSYLDFFIRINGHTSSMAVGKWMEDREYIAEYALGSARRVKVNYVINS